MRSSSSSQLLERRARQRDMRVVRRIEAAAEDADALHGARSSSPVPRGRRKSL